MGPLFAPDRFSMALPRFVPVANELRELIERVLHGHFPEATGSVIEVAQLDGLEVNSTNYKVLGTRGAFLLKGCGSQADLTPLEQQLALANELADEGVPMATNLRGKSDRFLAVDDEGRAWGLSTFVEGEYFSGSAAQTRSSGAAVGILHARLRRRQTEEAIVSSWREIDETFTALARGREQLATWFPPTEAALLEEYSDVLAEAHATLVQRTADLERLPVAHCHIDLHPHNVLVRDERLVAFLDVESLKLSRTPVALGFATYKLTRQSGVAAGGSENAAADAARAFLGALREAEGISPDELTLFEAGALFEVCRRVAIIARLNMNDAETRWNGVLGIQLTGLREIPAIFHPIRGT